MITHDNYKLESSYIEIYETFSDYLEGDEEFISNRIKSSISQKLKEKRQYIKLEQQKIKQTCLNNNSNILDNKIEIAENKCKAAQSAVEVSRSNNKNLTLLLHREIHLVYSKRKR